MVNERGETAGDFSFLSPFPRRTKNEKRKALSPFHSLSSTLLQLFYHESIFGYLLKWHWQNEVGESFFALRTPLLSFSHILFFVEMTSLSAGWVFHFYKKGLLGPELCNGFPLSFKTRKKWQDRNCAHELWSQLRIPCIFYTSYLRSFSICRAGLTASCSRKNKTDMIVLIKVMVFVRLPSVSVLSRSAQYCICTRTASHSKRTQTDMSLSSGSHRLHALHLMRLKELGLGVILRPRASMHLFLTVFCFQNGHF